ncbi:integral membrane protein [Fusarium coicis]|nr:integral membrane protein [Fusarium coicis]
MAAFTLPDPPSANKTNLAIAELVLYAILFIPALPLVWKHGKAGMTCWPIFLSYFPLRFVADGYQIAKRNDPEIPNAVIIMTTAGSIACLSLTIIGLIYEVNVILPLPPKRWTERILLAVTHLSITAGITLSTYGGAPKFGAPGGVLSQHLNQIGTCMMLFVMIFGVGWWLWWTGKRVTAMKSHPNFIPARLLLLTACAAFPFQLVRLGYTLTYSFTPYSSLDPVSGTFTTRLVLMFGMQMIVAVIVTVGGWRGTGAVPNSAQSGARQGFGSVTNPWV